MKFVILTILLFCSGLSAQITVAPTPPNGTVGQSYSCQFTASGGVAPYTFAGTNVPTGMVLETNGLLHGTCPVDQTFNLVVQATDSASMNGYGYFTVVIAPDNSSPKSEGPGGSCSLHEEDKSALRIFVISTALFIAFVIGRWTGRRVR